MTQSTCFFGELFETRCGSYQHGKMVFDEVTTTDKCTWDITNHLHTLNLNALEDLKLESNLILLHAGKLIYFYQHHFL